MKDKFDKQELRDTISEFRNYISRQNYDIEMCNYDDLDMLDKVFDYLKELGDYYEN